MRGQRRLRCGPTPIVRKPEVGESDSTESARSHGGALRCVCLAVELEEHMGTHNRVYRGELSRVADEIVGFRVDARDGEVGRVTHVTYERDYMIVDTGPWIFGRRVVVPTSLIEHVDGAGKTIELPLARDDVKKGPEYEPARAFDPEYVDALTSYYNEQARFKRTE
jgi:hypothetical protein